MDGSQVSEKKPWVARGILAPARSRDGTPALGSESGDSYPLDRQGSPYVMSSNDKITELRIESGCHGLGGGGRGLWQRKVHRRGPCEGTGWIVMAVVVT